MYDNKPKYSDAERDAIAILEPIAGAILTAIGAIHDAAHERAEADYWRARYNKELDAQIKHNDGMMANVLTAYLHPLGGK